MSAKRNNSQDWSEQSKLVDMHRLVQILYSTGTTSYPRTREELKHYTACSTKKVQVTNIIDCRCFLTSDSKSRHYQEPLTRVVEVLPHTSFPPASSDPCSCFAFEKWPSRTNMPTLRSSGKARWTGAYSSSTLGPTRS